MGSECQNSCGYSTFSQGDLKLPRTAATRFLNLPETECSCGAGSFTAVCTRTAVLFREATTRRSFGMRSIGAYDFAPADCNCCHQTAVQIQETRSGMY